MASAARALPGLSEVGSIACAGSGSQFAFFGAHDRVKLVLRCLPAARTIELRHFLLLTLVVEIFFVHWIGKTRVFLYLLESFHYCIKDRRGRSYGAQEEAKTVSRSDRGQGRGPQGAGDAPGHAARTLVDQIQGET